MRPDSQDDPINPPNETPAKGESPIENRHRQPESSPGTQPETPPETSWERPSRFPIGAGLAAFAAAGGGTFAAILEGAVFSGLMAVIVWGATGMIAANDFTRSNGPARPLRHTVRLVVAGSLAAVLIAVYSGGLAVLLTAILASLLGLLLVPSVASLIGAAAPVSRMGATPTPGDPSVPAGLDHRGYWQVNSALGGSGMWGYGFRRAYNPITGEAGEWLGPGLVRKSDDTVVRVDAKGRPR